MKHALFAAVLAILPASAQAAIVDWTAILAPGNEVPPVLSPGASGLATGTVDTASGLLSWTVIWDGLTGPAIGAHFHGPAPVTANAGVQVNIGNISGLTSPSIGSTVISAAQIDQLRATLWYVNVHTQQFPGGEIRGQVIPAAVPVPAGLPLLLTAGVALAALRRRAARR
jgi:hypothetical protein